MLQHFRRKPHSVSPTEREPARGGGNPLTPEALGVIIDAGYAPSAPKPVPKTDVNEPLFRGSYRSFPWFPQLVTTFVAADRAISHQVPKDMPMHDGVVEGCYYVDGSWIVDEFLASRQGSTTKDFRELVGSLAKSFAEKGVDTSSAAFQQELLRQVLGEPNLQVEHVLAGLDGGSHVSHIGFTVPGKNPSEVGLDSV